jgi:uncharacterized protein
MNFSEEPVHFKSRGLNLFGIFHPAKDGNRDFGIIFANSGMQNRVGPHRLYVVFARILSQSGYSVLRMDLPGIGESEGTIKETHFDAHNPDDMVSVIDFMKHTKKIKRIVLFGICGGARTILKAGSTDKRVDGLILWSLPIISIAPSMTSPDKLRKAFSLHAWTKYFDSSRGDLKSIYRDVQRIFWNSVFKGEQGSKKLQHVFFSAFSSYLRSGRPALFLYGEKDNVLIEEFKGKFEEFSANDNHSCEYLIIRNGNHTFTSMDTQEEAISETIAWLSRWTNREPIS